VTSKNQVWVSDITYIPTKEGWLYLAATMDLWSRKVVGWQLSDNLKSKIVINALHKAIDTRHPNRELIHHSDRGSQYASQRFRNVLSSTGILSSMSGTGNCYDNAFIESFWSTLKAELVNGKKIENLRDTQLALFYYIEIFYNKKRLHS